MVVSQPKQHSFTSVASQSSPPRRQRPPSSVERWQRFVASQTSEQQSSGDVQDWRRVLHIVPPHVPFVHASEQQSCGEAQDKPSAEQDTRHTSADGPGSHRPLQHEPLTVHAACAGRQTAGAMQTLPMQKPEQHSSPRAHATAASEQGRASTMASRGDTSIVTSAETPTSRATSGEATSVPLSGGGALSVARSSRTMTSTKMFPPAPAAPALASTGGMVMTSGDAPPGSAASCLGNSSPTFRSEEHRTRNAAAPEITSAEMARLRARTAVFDSMFIAATRAKREHFPKQRSPWGTRCCARRWTRGSARGSVRFARSLHERG